MILVVTSSAESPAGVSHINFINASLALPNRIILFFLCAFDVFTTPCLLIGMPFIWVIVFWLSFYDTAYIFAQWVCEHLCFRLVPPWVFLPDWRFLMLSWWGGCVWCDGVGEVIEYDGHMCFLHMGMICSIIRHKYNVILVQFIILL